MKKGDWLYGDNVGLVEVVGCGTHVVRLRRYGAEKSYTKPRGALESMISSGDLRVAERGDPLWQRGVLVEKSGAMEEIKRIMRRHELTQISLQGDRVVGLGIDSVVLMNDENGNILMPLT